MKVSLILLVKSFFKNFHPKIFFQFFSIILIFFLDYSNFLELINC